MRAQGEGGARPTRRSRREGAESRGGRWRYPMLCARFRGSWPPPGFRAAVSVSLQAGSALGLLPPSRNHPGTSVVGWGRGAGSPAVTFNPPRCGFSTPQHRPPALLQTTSWPLKSPRLFKYAQETTNREVLPGAATHPPTPEPVRAGDTFTRF